MEVKRRIRAIISSICFIIFNRICCCVFKLEERQICFLAETHRDLNGNLLAVYEYAKKTLQEHTCLVYTKEDRRERNSLKKALQIWKAISTSKYILLDDLYTATSYMKVRKGQELIQLWHGAGAYKKFGHSRTDLKKTIGNKYRVHKGYKKYTKVIVSGSQIKWCYAEAFGVDEYKVQALGTPRMDVLFQHEYVKERKAVFLEEYPELINKKLVLFAPTYRGTQVRDADYGFDEANLNGLVELLGEEYVVLTRWHPALKNNINRGICKIKNCDFGRQIVDFSEYGDVNDLLIACDILVTDYSSIIFDYFPLGKPVVYFAYDKEEYAGDRGLYYSFDDYVFGEVVVSFDELVEVIKREDLSEKKRGKFFKLFLNACDENSTERVCNLIWKHI